MHIDIEYCKKIEIPDNLKYMFTTVDMTIDEHLDVDGTRCTYEGDTIDGIPHGYGYSLYTGYTAEGTFMNGMMHGSIEIEVDEDEEDLDYEDINHPFDDGMRSANLQFKYGQLHGYQIWKLKDKIKYDIHNNGDKIYMQKEVSKHLIRYTNCDDTTKDFLHLICNTDGDKLLLMRRDSDYKYVKYQRE